MSITSMKQTLCLLLLLALGSSPVMAGGPFPYLSAGLTEREAAEHLLSRFTLGPLPGDVDRVLELGLEAWFEDQLRAEAPEPEVDRKLARLQSLTMTDDEIAATYPSPGRVMRMAGLDRTELERMEPAERREVVGEAYKSRGYHHQRELIVHLTWAKIYRGTGSPNQLREVMVDFWFNHLYVTATDNQARRFVGTYERAVIRRHALSSFGDLLHASARHPAMLLYLDNARSSAAEGAPTTAPAGDRKPDSRRRPGINENYARELLELHTLGVDGGYTQSDVEETARILTGWTVLPDGERRDKLITRLGRPEAREQGFVVEGDFFFNAGWHDAGEKTILNRRFPAGGGLREGEELLDLLASHPSTAAHLSRKIAVRFVSDDPPQTLVNRLAAVHVASRGDIKAVLRALVESPEFWGSQGEKIKSPFELAVSGVRVLNGQMNDPRQLVKWIEQMGQPLYRYQAPTGFPDRAEAWIGPGTLVERLNFASSLAGGKVRGVRIETSPQTAGFLGSPDFQKR